MLTAPAFVQRNQDDGSNLHRAMIASPAGPGSSERAAFAPPVFFQRVSGVRTMDRNSTGP